MGVKSRDKKAFILYGSHNEIEEKLNKLFKDFPEWDILFLTQSFLETAFMIVTVILAEKEYL